MGVFFVLLLVPIIIQHVVLNKQLIDFDKRNKLALGFFFLTLTLLTMFRHESVGNDTRNYVYFFNKYALIRWNNLESVNLEIGYSYFNKLVSFFSTEPKVFIAIAAGIVSILIYPTYKRLCVDASLTIVLFCNLSIFVMMFSGIRQMIAVGIGVIAYDFVRKRKFLYYLVMVIVAMQFHKSAFILLAMYPIFHLKITKNKLGVIAPILGMIFVFNEKIFLLLTSFLGKYVEYDTEISATGAYTMIILFFMFVVFAFIVPDERLMDEETIGLRNILILSFALQMFAPLHTLAMRMNYYFIIFIPLLLPKIIVYKNKRWKQIAIAGRNVMVIFFLVYFFVNAYSGDGNLNVFPYRFFWESA